MVRIECFIISGVMGLLLGGCAGESSQAAASSEFFPHFEKQGYSFAGALDGDHFYVLRNQNGQLAGELADNHKVVDVWLAREDLFLLMKQHDVPNFALVTNGELASGKWQFSPAPEDSISARAWQLTTNLEQFRKHVKKGRSRTWSFVDLAATRDGYAERVYVAAGPEGYPGTKNSFVPILVVREQRYTYYLDGPGRRVAIIKSDLTGRALEKMEFRPIERGSEAELISRFVASR